MLGYLDDGGSGCFVTLSNIPYARYNVYGIVASDQGSNTTYTTKDFLLNGTTWALGGAAATTATAYASMETSSANGQWTQILPGLQTGNYWKVANVTGGTLTIDGELGVSNVGRGSLAAVIIEEVLDAEPDGMPDDWETAHGLNVGVNDAGLDADGDGLLNLQEFTHHTDPQDKDSDNDGLEDGPEVLTHFTEPLNPDSDDDGLNDGPEVLEHFTEPLEPDSDGDELPDGWEVRYQLNPNDDGTVDPVNGAFGDPDDDHWDNFTEWDADTHPRKKDTDEDGLDDNEEAPLFTDPLDPDSDNDGLKDGEEVETYETYPTTPDSDADGATDGEEVATDHDPLDPDDTPVMTSPITWTAQKNVLTDADIALDGTLVAAYVFGANNYTVTIGAESIPFSQVGGNTGNYFTVNGATTGNASLDQLLNSHRAPGVGEWTYRLSGLTAGKTYQVQVIVAADRRAGIDTRTQVIGDGLGGVTGDLTRGGPGTAIGTFTASEAGSQFLDVKFGSVNAIDPGLTAVIVREVELSTLAISSFSLNPATQEITITWISKEGGTYDVEYSDNLTNWSNTVNVTPIPATGLSTSLTFPKPAGAKRFFRVNEN